MRIGKTTIDKLKTIYRLNDWSIRIKRSNRNSDGCAELRSRPRYKQGIVILYPKTIKRTKLEYSDESVASAIHHEFAEIVMADGQDIVPEQYHEEPWFIAYQDKCAEHIAQIVLGLQK